MERSQWWWWREKCHFHIDKKVTNKKEECRNVRS
jgi:hypothetical protein